ncbi:MAG TPA: helix-turn-helix domain-containing protein [Azospirillum sp.]|nr:helix-turn-helix domain-containing protein [Azospirillum sp.]
MSDQKLKDVIVVSSPTQGGEFGSALPTRSAMPSEEMDRQQLAERLRSRGWSYRRIAEELRVSYILVSRWLSGDIATPRSVRRTVAQPSDTPFTSPSPAARTEKADKAGKAAVAAASATGDEDVLALQFRAFEQYVREMVASMEGRHEALLKRQEDLIQALDGERAAAREREAELLAKLEEERQRWTEAEERFREELERFKDELRQEAKSGAFGAAKEEPGEDDADSFSFDDDSSNSEQESEDGSSVSEDAFSFGDDEETEEAPAVAKDAFSFDDDETPGEEAPPPVSEDAFSFDDQPEPEPEPEPKKKSILFWRR